MGLIASRNNTKESKLAKICPSYLDTSNHRFVLMDNMYVASLLITNYEQEMQGGFLEPLLSLGVDMQISLHFEKKDHQEVLQKITYQIGNTGSNIKSTYENQIDQNIMRQTYMDAKYIKEKMQLEGEELFDLSIYIIIYASSEAKLEADVRLVENMVSSLGLTSNRAYYKQEEAFLSGSPLMMEHKKLRRITRRNVLTEGLSSVYPFLMSDYYDEDGILFGMNEHHHSFVFLNRFCSNKYSNANMFILGTSGSGKSFFTKLMLIRNHYQNIMQFVVDPDREYVAICQKLNGTRIDFKSNCINIMEIRESSKEGENGFLEGKLRKLKAFFEILYPSISKEEESILEEKLIIVYQKKGITFEDGSLYQKEGSFKKAEDMPKLSDVYKEVKKVQKLSKFSAILKTCVTGSLKFLDAYTNVNLNNTIIVTDIFDIEEQDVPLVLYIITDFYWDMIKKNRLEKKILYFDEAWKLMNQNIETAEFIFKLFKTIRKFGGAATLITQDIHDFFRLEDGKYGKAVLSNAFMKCVFGLEENEIDQVEKVMSISQKEKEIVRHLSRGSCLLYAGKERILLDVEASKLEYDFITSDGENDQKE